MAPRAGDDPKAKEDESGARGVAHRGKFQPEEQVETAKEARKGTRRERGVTEKTLEQDYMVSPVLAA